jgi:hypothetical protein
MIYRTNGMILSKVRDVLSCPANDVEICQDLNSPARVYYTVLVIKDRKCIKRMLLSLENAGKSAAEGEQPYLFRFSDGERLCFAFPYRPERNLALFAPGQMTSPAVRERTAVNLVMECLSTPLPWPLLFLVLRQGNVHIEKDNTIYFTPYLDLTELDNERDEVDCVNCCVSIIMNILQAPGGSRRQRLRSLELIRKKHAKDAYRSFPELYRDIKLTALPEGKQSILRRLRGWWFRNRDILFRLLLILCVVIIIVTLIMFLSQLVFGDIPLLRLFEHSFDVIGTERLNR